MEGINKTSIIRCIHSYILNGGLIHPLSNSCCCGESRTSAITSILFYLGSQVDKKKRKHQEQHFQDLNVRYALEVGVKLWTSSIQLNLFTNIGLVSEMYG